MQPGRKKGIFSLFFLFFLFFVSSFLLTPLPTRWDYSFVVALPFYNIVIYQAGPVS